MDYTPFKKAGLLQREVSELIGVCRATVNRWYRGQTKPHNLVVKRVRNILARVDSAVEGGELPLDPLFPKKERITKIREVLSGQTDN